jgi:hypothetical protein
MDREKQTNLSFIDDVSKATKRVNNARFMRLEELDSSLFEVEMAKPRITINMPVQLGFFVLSYAKLTMLQFFYDVIDKFVDRQDYELMEMDTGELLRVC